MILSLDGVTDKDAVHSPTVFQSKFEDVLTIYPEQILCPYPSILAVLPAWASPLSNNWPWQ